MPGGSGLIRFWTVWAGLIWFDLVSSGQNQFQPVWSGLSWSGLVLAGLVWFEPVKTGLWAVLGGLGQSGLV